MRRGTTLSKEYRASLMRQGMEVRVCADGVRRNTLKKLTEEESKAAFWAKVQKGGPDECWMWLGATTGSVSIYGNATHLGKQGKAHRVAYEIAVGQIPKGLVACHKCDNNLCVNPRHIFIGTYQDNTDDKMRKGRHRYGTSKGEANPKSKWSEAQVLDAVELRKCGTTYKEIARRTGLTLSSVGSVLLGFSWGWLTGIPKPLTRRERSMHQNGTRAECQCNKEAINPH